MKRRQNFVYSAEINPPDISIQVGGKAVKSSKQMNVLGVLFDCTLNWAHHINKVLSKASSAKYAIRELVKI